MSWRIAAVMAGLLLGCAHAPRGGLLEDAKTDLAQGRSSDAYPLLERLHRDRPEDLEVARLLTEAAFRTGQSDRLRADVRRALERRDSAQGHYMLGLLDFAQSQDMTHGAAEELERAIALAPTEAELHHRLGLALLECEQYAQALPRLQKAVDLAPERPGYQLPLARAYARLGDHAGAVRALRAVVEGRPSHAEVATARALAEELEDPFRGFPNAARSRLELGMNWLKNADLPEQALTVFEDINHDYPDLAVVHSLIGACYQRQDDPARAVEELKKAVQLAPSVGKYALYLAELYDARKRADPAQEAFEQALANNPLLEVAYQRLGEMALERRDLPAARRLLGILVVLEPDNVTSRGKLAQAYQLDGDFRGAGRVLRDGLEKDAKNVDLLLRLGLLEADERETVQGAPEKKRLTDEARKHLAQVVELQPQNAFAAKALESLGP
jgi:tetratricopeptide (TPR) repeat protein